MFGAVIVRVYVSAMPERQEADADSKGEGAAEQVRLVRVTLRLPASLHDQLSNKRGVSGPSVNDLIVEAVAKYLGVPVPEVSKRLPGRKPRSGQR